MTDLKFAILGALYAKEPREETVTNLCNIKLSTPCEAFHAIQELAAMGYIQRYSHLTIARLTPSGAIAYEEAKDEREKQAEEKKQQRFDNKMAIASVLISLISFFSGVIVESQIDLVDWVLSLFH